MSEIEFKDNMTNAKSIELHNTSIGLRLILRNTNRTTKVGENIEFNGKTYFSNLH